MEKYIEPGDQIASYFQDLPYWAFAVLGFALLVAVGLDFINRRRREETVEYYDAVFHEELVGVYPVATRWPEDLATFMQPRLPILRDAFEGLRNFIPQDQLKEYNLAWGRFYKFSRAGGSENLGGNSASIDMEQETKQARQAEEQQIFRKMVDDLLAYTEQFKKKQSDDNE